ncbi:MAG: hypothetical protein QXD05_00200 [Candidatus Pacearchaeota archaeon]
MATSKFERRFTNNTGNPLLGAIIELVPQDKNYPEGKITLIEHPTRKGWYYKDGVPLGEYKIYINGSLYTQNIFHPESILQHIAALFDQNLNFIGAVLPVRIKLPTQPPAVNAVGNAYFDVNSRTIKVDLEGNGNYIAVGSGGGSGQTSGMVLISGDQTITGVKTFFNIDISPIPGSSFALPLTPPNTSPGRRTGAIYYDSANNVVKISKDGSGTNFLVLGSSEGENYVSLHGLSVHDGQINGVGIYMYHNGQVYALPVRNAQNGYYAEDAPGAIYIDETNKRILVNFGRSHYNEPDAINDEYFEVLPIKKVLDAVKNDAEILIGKTGIQRDFYSRIIGKTGSSIDMNSGLLQLPDVRYMGNPQYYANAVWTDNTFIDETGKRLFRLKIRFDDGANLYTKEIPTIEEVKDYIQSGTGQFSGTSSYCEININGANANDRYYLTPKSEVWNANDMLIAEAQTGKLIVRRGSNGTADLQFYWFRRKASTL